MEAQDKSTTFRVVDPAVLPLKPSSPNRLKLMIMSIFGGCVASFGLLVILDKLDVSVKNIDFIKELGAPVLAIIPRIQHPSQVHRRRRNSLIFFFAAGVYFLCIISLPAMEMLDLPYLDSYLNHTFLSNSSRNMSGSNISGATLKLRLRNE